MAVAASPTQHRGARVSGFLSSHLSFRSSHLVRFNACCVLPVPRVLAACCGTGRMLHLVCGVCAVLRTGCRVQCCAHAAACPLPAARRTRNVAVPCVSCGMCSRPLACRLLSVARYLLHALPVVCSFLRGVCCLTYFASFSVALLSVVRCTLSVVFSTLSVVCCMLHAACFLARCMSLLSAACCLKSGACCMLPFSGCMSFVVRCILPAACRMLSGSCLLYAAYRQLHFPRCISLAVPYISPMDVACCQLCVAHFPVVVCGIAGRWIVSACPFFVACRTFSVACGLFSVARPSVPCRMPCALSVACPISHRHVACAALRVVGCTLHVPCRMLSHVLSWLLAVPSCMSSAACRRLQRCRVT